MAHNRKHPKWYHPRGLLDLMAYGGNSWSGRTWYEIRTGSSFILFHFKWKTCILTVEWCIYSLVLIPWFLRCDNSKTTTTLTSSERWQQRQRQNWQGPMPLLESLVETTRNNPRITSRSPLEPNFTMQSEEVSFTFVEIMFFSCTMFYHVVSSDCHW